VIVRDDTWLERAYEQAARRVTLPPQERWVPRRGSLLPGGSRVPGLVLAGVVLAGLVAALLYATQPSSRYAPEPGGVLNPSPAPRLFTLVDADRSVLRFDKPPAGMRHLETASGRFILGYPLRLHGKDICEGQAPPDTNFVGGEVTHFTRDQFGVSTYRFLASWAGVYRDAESASAALSVFTMCFRTTWFPGQAPGDPKMGAEGFVFIGTPEPAAQDVIAAPGETYQAAVYLWRVDNMLLQVMHNGPSIDWRDAAEVARTMNARAR
jgi:hypothetical protein